MRLIKARWWMTPGMGMLRAKLECLRAPDPIGKNTPVQIDKPEAVGFLGVLTVDGVHYGARSANLSISCSDPLRERYDD